MGLFGFGGVGHKMEESRIQKDMNRIGATKGDHLRNCERCDHYLSPREAGSKLFGGCRAHQIKVFSNHVCSNFSR